MTLFLSTPLYSIILLYLQFINVTIYEEKDDVHQRTERYNKSVKEYGNNYDIILIFEYIDIAILVQ